MDFLKTKAAIKYDYNLKHLSWFKVGGNAEIFFKPRDIENLTEFLKENAGKIPITTLGAGSNLIIRDKGVKGIVIKLSNGFTNIEFTNNNLLKVGAGCLNFNLSKFCLANSIKGFEFLIGIPGTIGGGIAMNAGSYGSEFKDIVHSIEALDNRGNIMQISASDIGFKYRSNSLPKNLIFTKAFFNLEKDASHEEIKQKMDEIILKRSASQPVTEKTSGSTFANPPGLKAWELIEKAGLRGFKLGGACVSDLHCNFIINYNNASASDLEELGNLIIKKVKEVTGVTLEWEIKIIGKL